MKVPPRQIEQFLRQPAAEVRAILLYGADGGLLRERVQRLIGVVLDDPGDPFRFSELTPASLKDEPSRLADEMAALSLTGGRRLVRLRQTGNAQSAAIQAVLDDPGEASSDTLLLVEGGELSPRDSLRKLFESHARAAAVPCYADEGQTLETLICDSLAARGLGIEPSALAYLMANLGADRQITRSELEKLALFKGRNKSDVTLEEAEACIGDGAPLARDDVAQAVASGDQAALERALVKCRAAGESSIAILRSVGRHLQRLHLMSEKASNGGNIQQIVENARPPIFFKHRAIVRGQVQQWPPKRLGQALAILLEAELDCKTTGLPDEAVCGRALIRIANAARLGTRAR